jgi:hypothetical protein
MAFASYPLGAYAQEQHGWIYFYAAPYSLKAPERIPSFIRSNSQVTIKLPMPKDPGFQVAHEFGVSNDNPIAPVLTAAGMANSQGLGTLAERVLQPALYYYEKTFATSTFRRFSNVTELTMVSEGRKQYFFQYVMVPRNEEEARAIDDIVGSFYKSSYPTVASGLPERSYPQNLWAFSMEGAYGEDVSDNFLGRPLTMVLKTVICKRNDDVDPVVRFMASGHSNITLLGLVFQEFESGVYDPTEPNGGAVLSKSEISAKYLKAT